MGHRTKHTRAAPSCAMFNLGSSYFHVPLTTVRHLLNVESETTHGSRRQTSATRCLTRIEFYTKLDDQCSKLATAVVASTYIKFTCDG